MKKIGFYILITTTLLVITYLNLSITRANQIESFLKESYAITEDKPLEMVFSVALQTTLEPEKTFVLDYVHIEETIASSQLQAEIKLITYIVNNQPYLVFFIDNIEFTVLDTELSSASIIKATLMFNKSVTYDNINTKNLEITFSQLFEPNNQLFAIEYPYLFINDTFNLENITFSLIQEDLTVPIGTLNLFDYPNAKQTFETINMTQKTESLIENFNIINAEPILSIYEKHIVFPWINVIIEILVLGFTYILYVFIKRIYIAKFR